MHRRGALRLGAGIVVTGLLVACGSSSKPATSASTVAPATGATTELNIGAVPTIELGMLKLGESKGIFAKAGIELNIVTVDAGPNVVTGVISKQFDVGYTAYPPPLLAVAGGQPLRIVGGLGTVGAAGTNGDVVVKKGGAAAWKGLAGQKIASNAPRSLLSLAVAADVQKGGGDGRSVQIVPLPFGEMGRAVSEGAVAAAVIVEPFLTKARAKFPDLVTLGDYAYSLTVGSPQTLLFTSQGTMTAKADAMKAFRVALAETVTYGNAHLDEVRAAGATLAGLDEAQAEALPLPPFEIEVDRAGLKQLVDYMVQFGWIEKAPDLTAFVGP